MDVLERLREAGLQSVVRRLEERKARGSTAAGKWIPVRALGAKQIAGYVREGATAAEVQAVFRDWAKKRAAEMGAEGKLK
jgi:DNA repair ATPase RecN